MGINFLSTKVNENQEKIYPSANLINLIKSNYILKKVFSNLYEKRKLKLLIYNKNIQNKLGLNLEYFKTISGKEHFCGRNEIGIEYKLDTKKIIFKGQYKNGIKNGKGKEYYENEKIVKFEGEYLNGYKIKGKGYDSIESINFVLNSNGKGKEYKIVFEGEYLFGKRWNGKGYDCEGSIAYEIKRGRGLVKEYYCDSVLKFEGQYINGEKNGIGKEYFSNSQLEYESEYLFGERSGKGKEYNFDGNLVFDGEYLHGKELKGI